MGKRSRQESNAAAAAAVTLHPLLQWDLPETVHHILEQGRSLTEQDPDLCPGSNCCALCARSKSESRSDLLPCPRCKRVVYCCAKHLKQDDAHNTVCKYLSYIEAAEAIELEEEEITHDVQLYSAAITGQSNLNSWNDITPDEFKAVWECGAGLNAAKLQKRKQSLSGDEPGGEAAAGESSDSLKLVVRFAVSTSYLSYPSTILYCFQTMPVVQAVLQAALAGDRPVTICILGASSEVETSLVQMWVVLKPFFSKGLLLQFVGPEISEEQHSTVVEVSEKVKACFWSGNYHELADKVLNDQAPNSEFQNLPDVYVGFNMGLTCPDYDWAPSLNAMQLVYKQKRASADGSNSPILPLILTANTEVEGTMEDHLIKMHGWKLSCEWKRNPFTSLDTQQSGTLANDLYRKNAWLACYQQAPAAASGKQSKFGLVAKTSRWLASVAKRMGLSKEDKAGKDSARAK